MHASGSAPPLPPILAALAALLRRYLDAHCAAADAEGMSALCECAVCRDTRAALARLTARQGPE